MKLLPAFLIVALSRSAWGQREESREPVSPEGLSFSTPGKFELRGSSAHLGALYAENYDSIARFDLEFTYEGNPATASLEGVDYDLTAPMLDLRFDVEWFEISLRWARGDGSGHGRSEIRDGFLTLPGNLDFDFTWDAVSGFLEREILGFRGSDFRIGLAGGIGVLYLRERWEEIRITPDDPAFATATLSGSQEDVRWIGAVAAEIRARVMLGKGWFLSGHVRSEWHIEHGVALVAGLGIGLDF